MSSSGPPASDLYPVTLARYVDEYAVLPVVITSRGLKITYCNEAFRQLVGAQVRPTGLNLSDYLTAESGLRLKELPADGTFRAIRLAFVPLGQPAAATTWRAVSMGGEAALFGERVHASDTDGLSKVTLLNNEMVNLTRELARKAADLEDANLKVAALSLEDSLTGIANRRHFSAVLSQRIAEAERSRSKLSLVLMDLDRFKQVNDRHGHLIGDKVLSGVAELLHQRSRETDLVARFGGEEFVWLMPQTDLAAATTAVERLRKDVRDLGRELLSRDLTASYGVAAYRFGEAQEDFIGRADAALYRAKDLGRDRVVAEGG